MASDQRTLFRDYMKRLDPTENPAHAIDAGFYVPPPRSEGARISRRLEIEPTSSHLLMGGIGTGKTTELLSIQRELASAGDIQAVLVNIPSRHELAELQPGILMAIAAMEVCTLAEDKLEPIPKEVHRATTRIRQKVEGRWAHPDELRPENYYDGDPTVWVKGVLREPEPAETITDLEEPTASVVSALKTRLVVLFDGLDRLADSSQFVSVVAEDVPAIVRAGMGLVVVGPQHLRFGKDKAVQDHFTTFHLHGAASLAGDKGTEFLTQVLRARVEPEMLSDETCRELVAWSGGVVRDLVELARAAGGEAYASGANQVEVVHVRAAADRFGRSLLLGITPAMSERLRTLVPLPNTPKELRFTLSTETDIALLLGRLIIEIPGTPVRYIPHPVIVPLIRGLRVIKF